MPRLRQQVAPRLAIVRRITELHASLRPLKAAVAAISKPADVHRLRPQVRALQELVKRAKLGLELQNEVAEQAIRLERAAGRLLRQVLRQRGGSKARGAPLKDAVADLGIHKRTAQKWELLSEINDAEVERYFAEARASGREITTLDLLRRCKPPPEEPLDFRDVPLPFEERCVNDRHLGLPIGRCAGRTWEN